MAVEGQRAVEETESVEVTEGHRGGLNGCRGPWRDTGSQRGREDSRGVVGRGRAIKGVDG
jgi:hypothetical protein